MVIIGRIIWIIVKRNGFVNRKVISKKKSSIEYAGWLFNRNEKRRGLGWNGCIKIKNWEKNTKGNI